MSGFGGDGARPAVHPADPHGGPFLRTRFVVPARPRTFLRRRRLTEHLDQALRTPLTMVNGAAGAGKTLLVADWAGNGAGRSGGTDVAWLTTDTAGQGPVVFWAYLLEALRTSGAGLPDDLAVPARAPGVDPALPARLAAALSARERPVTVVLDEFDRVTDPEIHAQLEFVLHHAGPGLRLVLVTRTEPLLPLHRYRAAGELTEIRGAELAFTPSEAAALLACHGLRLPAADVRALVTRTEGWAAGLRLAALAAAQSADPRTQLREFEADRTTIADFLLAEVLKRQPPATQDLLLRISVLDRFSAGLVNALTLRGDAEAVLAGLSRANAFVEHLGHGQYRLHPLFAEILRAHLRMRYPGMEPELHRRAARWLRGSGGLTEALAHAAAAGDQDFTAAVLVDDLAIGRLFTGPHADDTAGLFARTGPGGTAPAVHLVGAARDLARGDLDGGLTRLRRAEQALGPITPHPAADAPGGPADPRPSGDPPERAGDPSDGPVPRAAALLSCALLRALAARLAGAPARAEAAAEAADRLRDAVPEPLMDGHPEFDALLLTHVGAARLWAGRFAEARAALSAVTGAGADRAATAPPRADALGLLALIDYLDGRLGAAERAARAAIAEAERYGLPRPAGSGVEHLVLAALALDRDETGQARTLLDAVDGCEPALRDPVAEAERAIVAGRLHLARGEPRAALKAVDVEIPAERPSPWARRERAAVEAAAHLAEGHAATAAELLARLPEEQGTGAVDAARVELAAGRPARAVHLLDRAESEGRGGPGATVRAALVRAQAADAVGDRATALRFVARALKEARHERLRRPFVDAGPWIRPLLGAPPLDRLAAGWLTRGGPAAPYGPSAPDAERRPPVVEELSGRERDVLRRLALMMSTQEIAADLYVSVNTVKTHLKSVYRKLAVNRRGEAVRRARELGLL